LLLARSPFPARLTLGLLHASAEEQGLNTLSKPRLMSVKKGEFEREVDICFGLGSPMAQFNLKRGGVTTIRVIIVQDSTSWLHCSDDRLRCPIHDRELLRLSNLRPLILITGNAKREASLVRPGLICL